MNARQLAAPMPAMLTLASAIALTAARKLAAASTTAFSPIPRDSAIRPNVRESFRQSGGRPGPLAASWTTLARGALHQAGRNKGRVNPRDFGSLRGCGRTIVGVEQHLPLRQDAGHPEQPVGDTA